MAVMQSDSQYQCDVGWLQLLVMHSFTQQTFIAKQVTGMKLLHSLLMLQIATRRLTRMVMNLFDICTSW